MRLSEKWLSLLSSRSSVRITQGALPETAVPLGFCLVTVVVLRVTPLSANRPNRPKTVKLWQDLTRF